MKPVTSGTPEQPTTTIGSTVIIRGKLKSDEDLVVEGRIEAEITSTKALMVENSGIVKANVQVKSARISGAVVGNITAEAKVELSPDGRVVGDILSPKIVIRDGAAFRGRIDMPDFDAPRLAAPEPIVTNEIAAPQPILVVNDAPPPDAVPVPPEPPWMPVEDTPPTPFPAMTGPDASSDSLGDAVFDPPFESAPVPPPKPPIPADRDARFLKRKRF